MSYLRCDGVITESVDGFPVCDSGWLIIPDDSVQSIFQAISISDSIQISGAIFLLWAVAFGAKFLFHQIVETQVSRR